MNWTIYPNAQLAKLADNKTVLKSVGEIHEQLNRNNWVVDFHALVLPNLHTNTIAGNNFMKDNKVEQSINNKTITILGKYVVPETNRNITLPTHVNNIIVSEKLNKVILPQQTIQIKVPLPDYTQVTVEPRLENKLATWPIPQICTINNGEIEIENNLNKPIHPGKHPHKFQINKVQQKDMYDKDKDYKYMPQQSTCNNNNLHEIKINKSALTAKQLRIVQETLEVNKDVFNNDLSKGYNHNSGKHFCRLNWANEQRPSSKKVLCPAYNSQLNGLLQELCDELTHQNVLGIPQEDNIIVQCVAPCFLRKKQKAKNKPNNELRKEDVRLVVNANIISKHLKNLPTKVTKPQEVYAGIAKWKYIIKTDLYQGFFQNHLHPDAYQWCAIQTPYGGIRYFKRSIQGLLGQTEEQDELLARVLHKPLQAGKCVKIADDMFTGGETIEDAIQNFKELMNILQANNLKISASKTVLFPKQVDILSWVWNQGGFLSPSPHRKQALADVHPEHIKTIKDLRSWIGLYKTFLDCTPNLTSILDPFDTITGGKDSKDAVTWTPELTKRFHKAQLHIDSMTNIYLPQAEDQLIITCDGARTPPAVGMILQARTPSGQIKTVRFYSVKLKPHVTKWFPCEIEASAVGTAIEAFYDYIKQSNKPVIICPDSKTVIDAANKIAKGHFSLSPRIQTFLNNLSKISYDIQHVSGKSGQNAAGDFQSRSATECSADLCQICNYVNQHIDTVIDVKLNAVHDIISGKSTASFMNRSAWKAVQLKDKACINATTCLTTGQTPSKKTGKTNSETRKIADKATIATDGLLVVKHTIPLSSTKQERIVIPSQYAESLLNQLHIKLQHPAKSQMKLFFNKYFFTMSSSSIIENMYANCQLCKSVQILPKQLQTFNTQTNATEPGTHLAIDVLRRAKQKIIVCRDQFSGFTTAAFIPDETIPSLQDGIIKITQTIKHPNHTLIRTDGAPAFKSLANQPNSQLKQLNITLEIGSPLNKNSNACVDKAIAELNTELKKIVKEEAPINETTLSLAINIINNKLRRKGQLSAADIMFSRDRLSNTNLQLDDKKLANNQLETRTNSHKTPPLTPKVNIKPGDIVMLTENPKKHHIRETLLVTERSGKQLNVQKLTNPLNNKPSQLRNASNNISIDKVMRVHKSTTSRTYRTSPPRRELKSIKTNLPKPWDPIRHNTSDSDTDSDEPINKKTENKQQHTSNSSSQTQSSTSHNTESSTSHNTESSTSHNNDATLPNNETINTPPRATGARPKIKEMWFTENHRTPRKAAVKCTEKITKMYKDHMRSNISTDNRVISPLDYTRDDVFDLASHHSDASSLNWDEDHDFLPPSELDAAFVDTPDATDSLFYSELYPEFYPVTVDSSRVFNFDKLCPLPTHVTTSENYPSNVVPGRVYNFSHLNPLPIDLTSPPPIQSYPVTSTPKPTLKEKITGLFKKKQ